MKKKTVLLIIWSLFLVSAAAVVWTYFIKEKEVPAVVQILPEANESAVANWRKYQDSEVGISFLYPPEWALDRGSYPDISVGGNEGALVTVSKAQQSKDYVKGKLESNPANTSLAPVKIGSRDGFSMKREGKYVVAFITSNWYVCEVSFAKPDLGSLSKKQADLLGTVSAL
ncbi:MAG: hypothetical protein K0S20_578 [Patescibacteria group bacterium]|jgi:hypothetical protein|nr:hypothetical protein [Patescibacteria group bacterium]